MDKSGLRLVPAWRLLLDIYLHNFSRNAVLQPNQSESADTNQNLYPGNDLWHLSLQIMISDIMQNWGEHSIIS